MIIIAHRGASGTEPENTLRAFRRALDFKAPALELDVYFHDGRLLVIHDEDLARTTNGRGKLYRFSLEEVRKFDAGKGEPIPFLDEVLDCIEGRAWLNIELKGAGTAAPVGEFLRSKVLARKWKESDFLVSSFDTAQLGEFRSKYPEFRVAVLTNRRFWNAVEFSRKLGAVAVNPSLKIVSPSLVAAAHDAGLQVFVYTVNSPQDFERLQSWGVDGIFTDFPERFL